MDRAKPSKLPDCFHNYKNDLDFFLNDRELQNSH